MKNYFIIHGTFGHNKENWFPWLEQELVNLGYEVFNFNYPTPKGHNFENWSKVLDQAKDKITEESVFICHSSAPIFLIKYCLTNNIKIGKLISFIIRNTRVCYKIQCQNLIFIRNIIGTCLFKIFICCF